MKKPSSFNGTLKKFASRSSLFGMIAVAKSAMNAIPAKTGWYCSASCSGVSHVKRTLTLRLTLAPRRLCLIESMSPDVVVVLYAVSI